MTGKNDDLELGQFIPLHYHYNMLNDTARMQGFKAALDVAVQPGAKVLELGGGTGVLSFFAAQKAGKVWCVEHNPELAATARDILAMNPNGDKIEVIEADAFEYLPPEPVDVVICEMVHVAMLREKQIPVIASFKDRYLKKFGGPLPIFVPEAFIQAVQPVQQSFDFEGYHAPDYLVSRSDDWHRARPLNLRHQPSTKWSLIKTPLPQTCAWKDNVKIDCGGILNALTLYNQKRPHISLTEQRTIDWFSQYLIVTIGRAAYCRNRRGNRS